MPADSSELALVLAELMLLLPLLPKALLTKMGVSYLTRENPELYRDIYYEKGVGFKSFVTETFVLVVGCVECKRLPF